MGKTSRELLRVAGIMPKLRLAIKKQGGGVTPTGSHRVKLLEEKIVKDLDRETGKEIEFVKFIFEENGEKKFYQSRVKNKQGEPNYFWQRMADVNEGDEVILECKRAGMKNYIEVIPVNGAKKAEITEDDIEEDEVGEDLE